jgi:hypothetical protein
MAEDHPYSTDYYSNQISSNGLHSRWLFVLHFPRHGCSILAIDDFPRVYEQKGEEITIEQVAF